MDGKTLSFPLKAVKITKVLDQMYKETLNDVCLYHPKEEKLLRIFAKQVPIVRAGGGLVKNEKGEILFIYRNGKWDLPKGKLDKGETVEEAALREVEEETGVKGLKLGELMALTYHVYKRNGKYKLKETHWYLMSTNYDGELVGQCDEGIKKVAWKRDAKVIKALKNSYANIKSLLEKYS